METGVFDLGFTGWRVYLPASLSDKTKTIIVEKELSADEFAGIVLNTINQINSGSVESIDYLVMKSLEKRLV